ncbi:hypothetical protein [Mycolicibacterium elephantis]|uniref:hypothetical protein n=1 Tax=Mycolicibacterium elephantis TaxID=81858 RepID=UPI0009EEA807|nr:hypothetical protein [Mycolicibacterium elephantis]
MTPLRLAATRILAGAFAAAVLAMPVITADPPTSSCTACSGGESQDVYTAVCVPDLVPNSPDPYTTIPGNPDMPAINGIPCGGHSSGSCMGLAEEQQAQTPLGQPHTSVESSP